MAVLVQLEVAYHNTNKQPGLISDIHVLCFLLQSYFMESQDVDSYLIWSSFILFPGRKKIKQLADEKCMLIYCIYFLVSLPSPLRNLFTPLGSGSGYESMYSATLASKRPEIKKESSPIHKKQIVTLCTVCKHCMCGLIWFNTDPFSFF